MKTTLFLLIFIVLQAYCGTGYSQNADNKIVAKVLNRGFNSTEINYIAKNKNNVLTKNSIDNTKQQKKITIKGNVTDMNGEPIIGANVLEKGRQMAQ